MKKIVHPVESQLFSKPFINKSCCWESTSAYVTTHQSSKHSSACGHWFQWSVFLSQRQRQLSVTPLHTLSTSENRISCGSKRCITADPLLGRDGLRSPSLLLLTSINLLLRSEMGPTEKRGMNVWLAKGHHSQYCSYLISWWSHL